MTDTTEHVWTVDGIEEGAARVEEDGKRIIVVPRYLLPPGVKEGEVLRVVVVHGHGALAPRATITVELDADATTKALDHSAATTSRAYAESKRHDPGGDVAL